MIFPATIILVILLDFLSKTIIRETFKPEQTVPIIKNVFHLTYVRNSGGAFGLFSGQQALFILISLIAILLLSGYYYLGRPQKKFLQMALGFSVGGTLGNLIDRLLNVTVTDFLDFRVWPVFNVADVAIVFGFLLLILELLKSMREP